MASPLPASPPATTGVIRLYDFIDGREELRRRVIAGLTARQKSLPWTTLFGVEGVSLFERVGAQPEYLATRTERAILSAHIGELVEFVGGDCHLIELGHHGAASTRVLIEHLRPALHLPVDSSRACLEALGELIHERYPWLNFCGLHACFDETLHLPRFVGVAARFKCVSLLGAAIARYSPREVPALLASLRALAGPAGRVLVSVDQTADWQMLEGAYNDRQHAMAAFNVGVLARINRELRGDFQVQRFHHIAKYNDETRRIEMGFFSQYAQFAHVDGQRIDFAPGEPVHTAIHCTYTFEEFRQLAQQAGLRIEKSWSDTHKLFSLYGMVAV